MDAQREQLEARIRTAWEANDYAGATELAIRGYGPEVLGFLVALHKNYDDAELSFSHFLERLWQGMQRFEWKCSVRTWAYLLARNAAVDVQRGEARHRRARVSDEHVAEIAQKVRTETLSLLRTETRDAFARLRDELPEEDRSLLVLRVDRDLEWQDVARVLGSTEATLVRDAAKLRKRFQSVKERLRALGKERGLV